MNAADLIRGLQERSARALPAEHVEDVGGWVLRCAPGCSWWVNSALPYRDADGAELARRVAAVERFYASSDTLVRFQISPGACPPELDRMLEARGYRRESPMSLQVATAETVLERLADGTKVATTETLPEAEVELTAHVTTSWFDTWLDVHGRGCDPTAEWALLERVRPPAAYACVRSGGKVVAVGRSVADEGFAGVFGMATLPEARGAGAARAVLAALAAWARVQRADRLYLQVEPGNGPAVRLYETAGFAEVCRYHYRARAAA